MDTRSHEVTYRATYVPPLLSQRIHRMRHFLLVSPAPRQDPVTYFELCVHSYETSACLATEAGSRSYPHTSFYGQDGLSVLLCFAA